MRAFNFSAGPAMLAEPVIKKIQEELLDWHGTGMSVMELGHRSDQFIQILEQTEQNFRQVLSVPDHYEILFFAAPARMHFSGIPMNLLRNKTTADYVVTGIWSKMAIDEGARYCDAHCVFSASDTNYLSITAPDTWQIHPEAAYLHYTENETINGLEFPFIPETESLAPLVCDMTSSILSKPLDISRFGMIYAGAQKNLALGGLSLAIIREDLLGKAHPFTPTTLNYQVIAQSDSLYYTPHTFGCYVAGLTCQWLMEEGGLEVISERNLRKAKKLYEAIDSSGGFYRNDVDPSFRSRMNVPFRLSDTTLEALFLEQARALHLEQLKGHRLAGGIRASMYNAMPEAGVDTLITFMKDFMQRNG